jgi:hypothetical protein
MQASPGDAVTFGFFLENTTDDWLPCEYQAEQARSGVDSLRWHVDGPANLNGGECGRGALTVRAPRNRGSEDEPLVVILRVSSGSSAVEARQTCTINVAPPAVGVRPKLTPNPDGTVSAKVSLLRRGRATVDAEVKFRRKNGWRFYPERPSITVRTSAGTRRAVLPKSRWYLPDVTMNPDGTVTVKVSLLNRSDVDVNASVRLRHDDGWWFSPESPELTVKASEGPVDVTATFRSAHGRKTGSGDQVTVQLQYKGVPVADATTTIHTRKPVFRRVAVAATLLPLALSTGAALLDQSDPPAPIPAVATPTSAPATTLPPVPPVPPGPPPPEAPAPAPPPNAEPPRPDGRRPTLVPQTPGAAVPAPPTRVPPAPEPPAPEPPAPEQPDPTPPPPDSTSPPPDSPKPLDPEPPPPPDSVVEPPCCQSVLG